MSSFEGTRLKAYRDPVGIVTVCDGETKGVLMGQTYTAKECQDKLATRLKEFDQKAGRCVHVPVSDSRRIAIDSFSYNVGVGAFCSSSFARKLNAGAPDACDELRSWIYAGKGKNKHVLPGLVKRREVERKYCLG